MEDRERMRKRERKTKDKTFLSSPENVERV